MKFELEASCDHLNRAHGVKGLGGQTSPIPVQFEADTQSDVQVGSTGTCLAAGRSCSHLCKNIELTHRSNSMALDNEMQPLQIKPVPPIEKAK